MIRIVGRLQRFPAAYLVWQQNVFDVLNTCNQESKVIHDSDTQLSSPKHPLYLSLVFVIDRCIVHSRELGFIIFSTLLLACGTCVIP